MKELTMIDPDTQNETKASARRWGTAAALVAAGLAGGVVIAGTVSANAADTTPTPSSSTSSGATAGGSCTTPADPSGPQRRDETLLTGDTAEKVRAAALARYPGATVERVETDSDGVYEAHIVTTDGKHVIVAVGKDFTVTGTQEMTGGPKDGRAPAAPSAAPSSSSTA